MSWRRFFRRRHRVAESARDIEFHIDIETRENMARGMPPSEARIAARRKFGNPTLIREEVYRMHSIGFFDSAWQDARYALRTMRKSPIFVLTAALILTLGIGANTAIFTVIHAVLLKSLEYREPDRLLRISADDPSQGVQDMGFTQMRCEQMAAAARSFDALGCFFIATEDVTLAGQSAPQALKAARVSSNFLQILGVKPFLGRSFLASEDRTGGPAVAMISAALWRSRFGTDSTLTGKALTLNAMRYTIIGVLPSGFQFPHEGVDVWLPRPSEFSGIPPQAWARTPYLIGIARLKTGVRLERARAELAVLNRQYIAAHPELKDADHRVSLRAVRLKENLVANVRPTLLVLATAVGLVLLIACANVASLLLARAASRSREFVLRAALGAPRGRLIRQLLSESVLLAFVGGGLGVLLAKLCLRAITHASALNLPRSGEIRLDWIVLSFTVALSIFTGVLFGLFPAFHASKLDLAGVLREHTQSAGATGAGSRGLLVIGQVALSMVLLIGAALLLESLIRLQSVDPGLQPAHRLTMQVSLPRVRYNDGLKRMVFYQELVRRVETIPGVQGAAAALSLPMSPKWAVGFQILEQATVNVNERPQAQLQSITAGYFRTLGIPLRRGREYTTRDDTPTAPARVIINESFARRYWPAYPKGSSPLGQHLRLGNDQTSPGLEIIGIAADVHEKGFVVEAGPELYLPCHMNPPQSAGFVVYTVGDPRRFLDAIRNQVRSLDREQPVAAVKTMDELLQSSVGRQRLTLFLLSAFALVALLLAAVGIYGLIAYSVTQRTQELGIRRALGAQQTDILWLVIRQGLALTFAGVGIRIAAALALTRLMKDLLFHVNPTNPATFCVIAILFVVVSLAAALVPAWRATRVDPMAALRTA